MLSNEMASTGQHFHEARDDLDEQALQLALDERDRAGVGVLNVSLPPA
jgi:hypothetical protein